MKRSRLLAWLLIPGSLAGCALPGHAVVRSVAADLAAAQAVAAVGGDKAGMQCWGKLLPVVQALQAPPMAGGAQNPAAPFETPPGGGSSGAGVATVLEVYRIAVIQAEGPCAPVVLPVVAKLGPLFSAAGGLAAVGTIEVP